MHLLICAPGKPVKMPCDAVDMKALQKLSSCHTEVMRFHKVSRQVNLARPCWFKEGPPVNESDFSKVR